MALQLVGLGSGPDTAGSDNANSAFTKVNANFVEVYTLALVSTQAGSYTAVLGDAGTVVEMTSASANNFTVPPNSSVAFTVGTILGIYQYGAGQSTLVAGAGVTIRTPSTLLLRTQYSLAFVRKRATDEWVTYGDLA